MTGQKFLGRFPWVFGGGVSLTESHRQVVFTSIVQDSLVPRKVKVWSSVKEAILNDATNVNQ